MLGRAQIRWVIEATPASVAGLQLHLRIIGAERISRRAVKRLVKSDGVQAWLALRLVVNECQNVAVHVIFLGRRLAS